MSEEELLFQELLEKLPDNIIQHYLKEYISEHNLHSSYINLITDLSQNYIDDSNCFIERFKRNVNMLYVDKHGTKNVLKKVDIDKENWFWYARLLQCTEDEKYPNRNFLRPTYLLERLKITDKLTKTDLQDDELKDLYDTLLQLYEKYKICSKEEV